MTDESEGSVDSLVRSVFQSVRAQMASISTGAHLAWAEVRVVAGHVGLFIGLVIVAAGIVVVGWGLILLLGALILMSIGFTAITALVSVLVLNVGGLIAICLYMRHTLNAISFKHSRRALGLETGQHKPTV